MSEVKLTIEEAAAIYSLVDMLAGGNASQHFLNDGTDDPKDPMMSGFAKICLASGNPIPDNFQGLFDGAVS